MSGLELNKVIASILVGSLLAMLSGFFVDLLYKPDIHIEESERGFVIETKTDTSNSPTPQKTVLSSEEIKNLIQQASAARGKNIFKKCISCHSVEENGSHKIGPNLFNIVGSPKASKESFPYSKALKEVGGVWDEESLFFFLQKPSKYIVGTKMSFIGLRQEEEIADVIAYLTTYK